MNGIKMPFTIQMPNFSITHGRTLNAAAFRMSVESGSMALISKRRSIKYGQK